MDNHRVKIIWLIVVVFLFLSVFFAGRNSVTPTTYETEKIVYDTITHEFILHDTVWREREVYVELPSVIRDVDTVFIVDTVLVEVPIYKYHFNDDLYDISIEGFGVSLNSVTIYPRTEYKTTVVTKRNRWGLGIQAGYGISRDGLSPYIGVGVSYNLLTW